MKQVTFCLLVFLCFPVIFSPEARAFQRGAAGQNGYNLVLFPIKVLTPWGEGYERRTEILAIEGIANTVANDVQMALKYTYFKTGDTADAVLLKEVVGRKNINVWRQVSLFSNYSPDWSRVKAIGADTDVDIAVLIRIKKDEDSLVVIYLYDYKNRKIYSKTSKGVHWGSMATGVQIIAETLIQDFYANQ